MKKLILSLLCSGSALTSMYAQDEPQAPAGKLQHHAGVQINELIRQVFNFNNNNNAVNNNPYLLVYSLNSVRSGWGIRAGAGYTYRSFIDDDGVNKRESDINEMQFRLGAEKAFRLSPRWTTGIGVDLLYNLDNNETNSLTRAFDTTITITRSRIHSYGVGPMAWLRYNVTDRVILGTETSFYYLTGNQKQEVSITTKMTGQPVTTQVSKVDNQISEAFFRMPVAFYLLIRF